MEPRIRRCCIDTVSLYIKMDRFAAVNESMGRYSPAAGVLADAAADVLVGDVVDGCGGGGKVVAL